MDFNYVFFPDHLTCKCTLYKKMRHFCDIGLHNCNFLLDYNDLTPNQKVFFECGLEEWPICLSMNSSLAQSAKELWRW